MQKYSNIQFEDPMFLAEFEEILETGNNEILFEVVEKISNGTPLHEIIENLIQQAKLDGYQVDKRLSDVFFVLSELLNLSKEYRDLTLDTSILLSEDAESRTDINFDPEILFYKIKSTTAE